MANIHADNGIMAKSVENSVENVQKSLCYPLIFHFSTLKHRGKVEKSTSF